MKLNAFLSLTIQVCLISFSTGQESSPKEPRLKQLSQAYGFVVGQQASLEKIEKNFPDLAQDIKQSLFVFNSSALGESTEGVEAELSNELGGKWPDFKEKLYSQIQETIVGQQLTREQATAFLTEVKLRGKGELPDSIRSTLLSAIPRFAANPGLELTEGWKQTFRTKGHPKAKGSDFSVSFPASWSKRDGSRPNIIQNFQSGAGHGPVMCSLMVKDMPLPDGHKLSADELKDFFQPNELKDMVPNDGTFIEGKYIVLDGSPAGMLVSDQTKQRLDISITMRTTQFVTIHESSMIFIQFALGKIANQKESLEELQRKYISTYLAIANTFVNNDRYK